MLTSGTKIERPSPDRVSSLVYHELGTPLATALWYIGIAETHCASMPAGAARSALAVARSEVQRLKQLVDRVMELERLGHAVLKPTWVDLGTVVQRCVERNRAWAGSDEKRVRVEVRGALAGWWDDVAIEQVVWNLLSNALKFGEGRPIAVTARAASEGAWIVVRDGGMGVHPSDQKRIFERHVCAPPSKGGGLGLGLWLVRELVQAHRGRIVVRSRPGQGATFQIFLQAQPRAPEGGAPANGVSKSGARPARRAPAERRPELTARRSAPASVLASSSR
ncbi:MAG TPA: HAMP domain-containing sensor histidine kinase [Polyangia bacterium]|nr:HAMP domain-containing sensor histidine kinase [Polyangia bacterium]